VEIFVSLSSGACLLIVPTSVKVLPSKLADILFSRHRVTVLQVHFSRNSNVFFCILLVFRVLEGPLYFSSSSQCISDSVIVMAHAYFKMEEKSVNHVYSIACTTGTTALTCSTIPGGTWLWLWMCCWGAFCHNIRAYCASYKKLVYYPFTNGPRTRCVSIYLVISKTAWPT
jgi:hypothetical protein